jgi:hypothetical protein
MRATRWSIAIAAAGLSVAWAQSQAPEKPQAGAAQPLPRGDRARDGVKLSDREVAGVVAEVRPVEGTIRVKADGGPDREIVVRSATEISIEGRRATLEEIHPGVELRASVQGAEPPVAIRIEVGPGLATDDAPPDQGKPGDATPKAESAAENEAGERDPPDR